jgi:LruC domain-containing protein
MTNKTRSIIFALALFAVSCKKENTVNLDNEKLDSFSVPAGFDFRTMKVVNLNIGITDSRFGNSLFVVQVYLSNPTSGAVSISKGSASITTPFVVPVTMPASLNELYIVKTAVDGSSTTQVVNLESSNTVSLSLSNVPNTFALTGVTNASLAPSMIAEPSCGRSTSDKKITISGASDVVCYTSTTKENIEVTANSGGTLKINAPNQTITIKNNFDHTNLKIFVGKGTKVEFDHDLEIKSGEVLVNNGTIETKDFTMSGTLINNGTITFDGNTFNLNSGAELTNYGTATVDSSNPTINSALSNSGLFTFNNNLTINSSGSLVNNCSLTVNENFTINSSKTANYKLIVVKGNTYINSGAILYLYNGAMLQTNNLTNMDGLVVGVGESRSLFQVVNSVGENVLSNGGYFKGNLQYWGKQDIEDNQNKVKHFSDGATKGSNVYIVKDECNTIGNGTAPAASKPDTDKDGIIDELDDYPTDPNKAFNNHSCNYEKGGSTIIFEDNWPAKADYDLNDIVFRFRHLVVTNTNNVIVRLEGEWKLVATGGDFKNGAGIMFNLPKEKATNFKSSNGLQPEAGQDSLVVLLFENSRSEMATWNTKPGEALSKVKTYTFSFDVTNGPTLASIGAGGYNPFIWNGSAGFGRGYETHLYGKGPTKLADTKLFGTQDDAYPTTKKYYTTKENLPWGIEIPVADFQYPIEYSNITTAYLKFATWANSGGHLELNWYGATGDGYRNNDKIFVK